MVGANKGFPSRKSFAEMLCAFADFRTRHDDAVLVLHTETSGNYAHGENLDTAMLQLGIPVDSVLKTGPYDLIFDPPPAEVMSRMYSSLDVLSTPPGERASASACSRPRRAGCRRS